MVVTGVVEHESAFDFCLGKDNVATGNVSIVRGCFDRRTGLIHLQAGMIPALRACVLSHEKKHADGYNHSRLSPRASVDCGNGTVWIQGKS